MRCGGCTRVHRTLGAARRCTRPPSWRLFAPEISSISTRASRAAVSYAVERAERRFAGSASPEIEKSAREHLSASELNQVDAIARAMALANLSLNTLAAAQTAFSDRSSPASCVREGVVAYVSGQVGSDRQRSELLAGLRGRVLEVGAGDGRNFAHYPSDVSEVLAVEPEPYLRRLASHAARAAPVQVTVIDGTAERCPTRTAPSIPSSARSSCARSSTRTTALAELHRVPHARRASCASSSTSSPNGVLAKAVQAGLDGSGIWPHLGAGCHLARDTVGAIAAAGFTVEQVRRFGSGPGPLRTPVRTRHGAAQTGAGLGVFGTAEGSPRSTRCEGGTRQRQLTRGGCAT